MNKEMQELEDKITKLYDAQNDRVSQYGLGFTQALTSVLGMFPVQEDDMHAEMPPKKSPYPQAFETWWSVYPRKVGKRKAFAAWKIAVGELSGRFLHVEKSNQHAADYLTELTATFADSPKGNAGSYTPHPTTWLNQGRYDDDPAEWQDTGDNDGPQVPVKFRN